VATLQQWFEYVSYCAGEPMQAPVCRPFWTWAMIAVFAIGALLLIVAVWKIVSYKMKLAAARQAERRRAHVDTDAIAQRSWDGDKAYSAELGGDEVERRIREAVEQRRSESPPFPNLIPPDRQG
jgi:hypothetical protein